MNLIWLLFAAMFFLSLAGFIASWLPGLNQGVLGRFRWLAIPLAIGCVFGVARVPFETNQFRMTVNVDTPDGRKVGSSIIRVVSHWGFYGRYMGNPGARIWFRHRAYGTAPIVDMGKYGTLAAALEGGGDSHGLYFRPIMGVLYGVASNRPKRPLTRPFPEIDGPVSPTKLYPPLLYLPPGTNNPYSFKQLAPFEFEKNIGEGVKLVSIVIEPAPYALFTERVENAPEWLWTLRRYSAPMGSRFKLMDTSKSWLRPRYVAFETELPPRFHDLEIE